MRGKGFLLRGTLAPVMGSTTGGQQNHTFSASPVRRIPVAVNNGKLRQGPSKVQNNRIPSSISLRTHGAR